MPKPLLAAAVGVGVLASSLIIAMPANAATLPDGDALYTISCGAPDEESSALYSVDADTAAVEQIGEAAGDCATGAAVDPRSGTWYYISRPDFGAQGYDALLAEIDPTTGARRVLGVFPAGDQMPVSLAIGLDGVAYAISYYSDLYRVNLVTGEVETIGNLGYDQGLDAFAVDPTSGRFYAVAPGGEVIEVDVEHAETTTIGTLRPGSDRYSQIAALQIDSDGRWWINAVSDGASRGESHLYSSQMPSGDTVPEFEGEFDGVDGDGYMTSQTLLLTFPPLPDAPSLAGDALPGPDSLFTVSCGSEIRGKMPTAYRVDPASALATPVGTTTTGVEHDCPVGAAYDPTSGRAYYFSEFRPTAQGRDTRLVCVDLATGAATVVATLPPGDDPMLALAIGLDGAAYAISGDAELYSIDLETAGVDRIGQLPSDIGISAFAVDPTSGLFYGADIYGTTGIKAWQIDVANATATSIGTFAGITYALGLQIDTSSRWWLTGRSVSEASVLFSTERPTHEDVIPAVVGIIDTAPNAGEIVTRTLIITPGQHGGLPPGGPGGARDPFGMALPPTGPGSLGSLMAVALVLVIAGAVAIRVRRQVS